MLTKSTAGSAAAGAPALLAELTQVEQLLDAALAELQPPFRQLVQAQFAALRPLARAAVVLTAAVGAPDTLMLRSQRLDLAAALEMLSLATQIHTRLLTTGAASTDLDRTLLGSTILAGDFCFSRAAGFAVKTGSAAVVEIFAQTLKQLSETHLRALFAATSTPAGNSKELFVAGLLAASNLVGWETALVDSLPALGAGLAQVFDSGDRAGFAVPESFSAHWTPEQATRWAYLPAWLAAPPYKQNS